MTTPPAAGDAAPGTVHLSDVQRVLGLFAQGLAGRALQLRTSDAMVGGYRPIDPRTDLPELALPASIARFAVERENFGAYRVAVLHQIGYVELGTAGFRLEALRAREPGLPRSPEPPPPVPGVRVRPPRPVHDLERFFALWPAPVLMRRVFATLEDLRVDASLRERYPGARADIARVLGAALADRPEPPPAGPVSQLLEALVRRSLGAPRDALARLGPETARSEMLDAADALARPGAGVLDSACAALACWHSLVRAAGASPGDDDFALDAASSAPGDASGVGVEPPAGDGPRAPNDEDARAVMAVPFRGDFDAEFVRHLAMIGVAGALPEGTDASGPPPDDEPRDAAADPARSLQWPVAGAPAPDPEARTFLYDEWDYHRQAYLKGWCRLYELRLAGDDFAFVGDVRRRHAELAQQVRRRFRFIRPESRRRVHRVSEGDELDLDGLIEATLDRRSGHAGDEHVYVRRDKALRDVAAAFLVDMSASTDIPVPDPRAVAPATAAPSAAAGTGDPENDPYPYLYAAGAPDAGAAPAQPVRKRRVIDVAKEALVLMGDALATLGDGYAIYGFSGEGRQRVEVHVAKDFEDRVSPRTWSALAAMEPRRSTRMGPAIRHALAKLRRQPVRVKVLIVVSDGYPQDDDYGPDRTDDEYGIQDTAKALQEAEREGVRAFCITIDPAGYDYLRRMCREHRYLVIDDIADLPGELTKVYRSLTMESTGPG